MTKVTLVDMSASFRDSLNLLYDAANILNVDVYNNGGELTDDHKKAFRKSADDYVSLITELVKFEDMMGDLISPDLNQMRRVMFYFAGQLAFLNAKKGYLGANGTSEDDELYKEVTNIALDAEIKNNMVILSTIPLDTVATLGEEDEIQAYSERLFSDSGVENVNQSIANAFDVYLRSDVKSRRDWEALSNEKAGMLVAFGHWYVALSRLLDFGGNLYTGLPSQDNLKEFLTMANIHADSVYWAYEHLTDVISVLGKDVKNVSTSRVYISMYNRMSGFIDVVDSYITKLEPLRDKKTTKFDKYVHFHKTTKILHEQYSQFTPAKVKPNDVVYEDLSSLITYSHELVGYKGERGHYHEEMIPILKTGVALQRKVHRKLLLESTKSRNTDLLTLIVLKTIGYLSTTYIDSFVRNYADATFNGNWNSVETDAFWHPSRLTYLAVGVNYSQDFMNGEEENLEGSYKELYQMYEKSKIYSM